MAEINLDWHAGRVLFGLSRIGYRPHDAIADIVDNSINYGARNVRIFIKKEREELSDTRKANIKEYLVIDDGDGMDAAGIQKALTLGSDELSYQSGSLSKFGLGLKSASFSLGKILEVISSKSKNGFLKFQVDLNKITDRYFCEELELSDEDTNLIKQYIGDRAGTIIRVKDVHKENHPSPKKTLDMLNYKLGAIYYYFLKDGIKIFLNDSEISAFDVLFTDEATANGNLNEHTWNGRDTRWIKTPTTQTLDIGDDNSGGVVRAIVEVTQLPHPPTFALDGEGEQAKIREKYKIETGNHGFYVYRNKRLISWAERFDGIISGEQSYWAFRGRILLDDFADDAFNIDVKKSHLELSADAHNALSDLTDEYKRKSRVAWDNATKIKNQIVGQDTNTVSNEIALNLVVPDDPSHITISPEDEKLSAEREKEYKRQVVEKIQRDAVEFKKSEGVDAPSDADIRNYVSGNASADKRIFRVTHVEDNLLWEPYFDDEHGVCVRINQNHRFARLIFEDNKVNSDLGIIFDLLMLYLVHAEKNVVKDIRLERVSAEKAMQLFREQVSSLLTSLLRNQNIKLPPSN